MSEVVTTLPIGLVVERSLIPFGLAPEAWRIVFRERHDAEAFRTYANACGLTAHTEENDPAGNDDPRVVIVPIDPQCHSISIRGHFVFTQRA